MKNKLALAAIIGTGILLSVSGCEKVYQYGLLRFSSPTVDKSSDIPADMPSKGISVFASRDNSQYFDNKNFHYDYGWKIDCQDHWKKSNYKFIAICPYKSSEYVWNPSSSTVSFNFRYGYPSDGLCLTSSTERQYDGNDNSPVSFQMKHVNSRLSLIVRNRTNSNYIKVKECYIYDLKFKGSVTVSPQGTAITVDDSLARKANNLYRSTIQDMYVPIDETRNLFPNQVTVAPQAVDKAVLYFIYADNSSTTPVMFYLNNVSEIENWVEGKTYVYTVDIYNTSAEISVSVQDWIDVNINL